jgi:hypothetical protein
MTVFLYTLNSLFFGSHKDAKKRPWRRPSVPGTVHLGVLAVGERIDEPEGMLTGTRVEFVQEHGIRGAIFAGKLQLRIAENDFAFIGDAEFGSDLQHDLHFVVCCSHRWTSCAAFSMIGRRKLGCAAMME